MKDPTTQQERNEVAARCARALSFEFTTLVDTMDDRTGARWAGWPERLFVIDKAGKVVYAGQQGPFGFWPTNRHKRNRMRGGSRIDLEQPSLESFLEHRDKDRE